MRSKDELMQRFYGVNRHIYKAQQKAMKEKKILRERLRDMPEIMRNLKELYGSDKDK